MPFIDRRCTADKNVFRSLNRSFYNQSLEDDLLMRLSSAGDNILSDSALVENLEHTKQGLYSALHYSEIYIDSTHKLIFTNWGPN